MSEQTQEFYTLDAECPNCHFSKKAFEIPKGKRLPELECPRCGLTEVLTESIQTGSYYDIS